MQATLPFPDIGPELFALGFVDFRFVLRWYALSCIVGLLVGWRLNVMLARRPRLWPGIAAPMQPGQVGKPLTAATPGVRRRA